MRNKKSEARTRTITLLTLTLFASIFFLLLFHALTWTAGDTQASFDEGTYVNTTQMQV